MITHPMLNVAMPVEGCDIGTTEVGDVKDHRKSSKEVHEEEEAQ